MIMESHFELKESSQCEQIYTLYDKSSGLMVAVALHTTRLGPTMGGCRMIDYIDEEEALADVTRLAKSMTYKSALAGIKYGGGKSVIIKPRRFDRKKLFTTFGKFVDTLNGKYITAVDSGTSSDDMKTVACQTSYVTGYTHQANFINPSYCTAQGIFQSLCSTLAYKHGSCDFAGKKILIKGIGSVGYFLAKLLYEKNVKLFVSDIDIEKSKRCERELNAIVIKPENILDNRYDVISPCDTEFTVTRENVSFIKTDILIGATNNQLEYDDLAEELAINGVLYCPDYVVNAGGLICVASLYEKKSHHSIMHHIKNIALTTEQVLKYAETHHISTKVAADQIATEKLYRG